MKDEPIKLRVEECLLIKDFCVEGRVCRIHGSNNAAVRDAQIEPNMEESVGCIDQHVLIRWIYCFWIRNYCDSESCFSFRRKTCHHIVTCHNEAATYIMLSLHPLKTLNPYTSKDWLARALDLLWKMGGTRNALVYFQQAHVCYISGAFNSIGTGDLQNNAKDRYVGRRFVLRHMFATTHVLTWMHCRLVCVTNSVVLFRKVED